MAYALVLASRPVPERIFHFHEIYDWIRAFFPAPVYVSFKEIDKNLFLYIVTMPHPEIFHSKNRIGKKGTLNRWMSAVKNNNIEHYLVEKPLKEYINGEWSINKGGYITESIRKNMHVLFSMEPLKELNMQTMTITLSGAKKEFVRPEMIPVLSNFKLVNVIGSDNDLEDIWDEFMTETGVPVCITEDFGVLSRSDIWISYEETNVDYPFDGIKIGVCAKNIIYPERKRQYRIGYTFQKKLLKKLGVKLVQRFNSQLLSEFLLHMLINRKEITINEAEEFLGVKISILSVESLSLCS